MNSWKLIADSLKRFKSLAATDVSDTDYHELSEDSKSAENVVHFEDTQLCQTPLKGLDALWWSNASPSVMWRTIAEEGNTGDMRELFKRYPYSVMDITTITAAAPLHFAVRLSHSDKFRWHVQILKKTDSYGDVINRRDHGGNTVLHLATSMKQLQTPKSLLEERPAHRGRVEANAKNSDGFTALDILDVQPAGDREIKIKIEKILPRSGASTGKSIMKQKLENRNHEFHAEVGNQRGYNSSPPQNAARSKFQTMKYHGLLLIATLFATMTFHAALRAPSGFSEITEKEYAEINPAFILFNSVAFFTSLALITVLTNELPIKPWFLIVLFSAIGAYMCLIMTISPNETVRVFILGGFILLAAFFKCLAWDEIVLDYLELIHAEFK